MFHGEWMDFKQYICTVGYSVGIGEEKPVWMKGEDVTLHEISRCGELNTVWSHSFTDPDKVHLIELETRLRVPRGKEQLTERQLV